MKYQFYLLSFFIFLFLFSSCGKGKNDIHIKGEFKHLKDGQFFVFSNSPEWDAFDTIEVKDGKFSFSHPASDTLLVTLQYPNFMQTVLVAIPGNTIKIEGNANSLLDLKVTGNEENNILTKFHQSVIKYTETEKQDKAELFIKAHPSSFASLALFTEYFLNTEIINWQKVKKLMKLMLSASPTRTQLRILNSQLGPLLTCYSGNKLPSFSATTLNGQKINNSTFIGKLLLINFWSDWTGEQTYPVSRLHQDLKKYSRKINLLNICLDMDTTQCLSTIKRDTVNGYNVCDRRAWDSPLIKIFGVRILPGNILVNKQGKIIARDIQQQNLTKEIDKYLK